MWKRRHTLQRQHRRDKHTMELDIIPLNEGTYCHAIAMAWKDDIVVMKPLDRVSHRYEQGMYNLT